MLGLRDKSLCSKSKKSSLALLDVTSRGLFLVPLRPALV
jgi:hypothetical protein